MKTLIWCIGAALTPSVACAGAWGTGSFENDSALDWVQNWFEPYGIVAIASAFAGAVLIGEGNDLDVDG
ncbi:MAG: DUF4259 domain-containing protein, partial [Opitutaceae bacterium]